MKNQRIDSLPIVVVLPVSRCNCRCLMCGYWSVKEEKQLETADIARLVPELISLGVQQVAFTGGEPLLHPDLKDMCALV